MRSRVVAAGMLSAAAVGAMLVLSGPSGAQPAPPVCAQLSGVLSAEVKVLDGVSMSASRFSDWQRREAMPSAAARMVAARSGDVAVCVAHLPDGVPNPSGEVFEFARFVIADDGTVLLDMASSTPLSAGPDRSAVPQR